MLVSDETFKWDEREGQRKWILAVFLETFKVKDYVQPSRMFYSIPIRAIHRSPNTKN